MRATIVLASALLSACGASLGSVDLMTPNAEHVGLKLLRPGAVGRSCRASVVGFPLGDGDATVDEALGQILGLDAEGDVVAHAEIRRHDVLTGLYNRRCVEVRGDLARTVSTVMLPAPAGHRHEGHH